MTMTSSSVTLQQPPPTAISLLRRPPPPTTFLLHIHHRSPIHLHLHLQASRRPPAEPDNWRRKDMMSFSGEYDDDDEDEEEEEEEEDDRSLDLLIKFVENVFKKVSKRARKAVRSVLPLNIPTKLVGFSVNGVIILAFFWILKAFLEVVCTLGSVVFVSILLVRGVWTGISYFQEGRYRRTDDFDDENQTWTRTQPNKLTSSWFLMVMEYAIRRPFFAGKKFDLTGEEDEMGEEEGFAPQLHESAGGLPKTKLVSHSCPMTGSTSSMAVSIPHCNRGSLQGTRVHESFKLGRPPALS
ncbi:protein short hypocotyl in white light 1 [Tanacetum coccineum]